MRVLVEPGTYSCANMGDVAMLQVAVRRLTAFWPSAQLHVFTRDPMALARHCPAAIPMATTGRESWLDERSVLGRAHGWLPSPASRELVRWRRHLQHRRPATLARLLRLRARLSRRQRGGVLDDFLSILNDSRLVLIAGQATLTDGGAAHASEILGLLEAARAGGMPAVLVGQGIGPLTEPTLRARAAAVLPHVALIAVRERRAALPLLDMLGVPAERVAVTGDDAVELAYAATPASLGAALGVSVRVAGYAGTDTSLLALLRDVLGRAARRWRVPVLPIPIAHRRIARDADHLRILLQAIGDASGDGGATLDTPAAVVAQAGRCRVVVAGAYHAAVFSLAQGVSTICLVGSDYYRDKFVGLADLFGDGCRLVEIGDTASAAARLGAAMDEAWEDAERQRHQLLAAAARQVLLGHATYARVARLVRPATLRTAAEGRGSHAIGPPVTVP